MYCRYFLMTFLLFLAINSSFNSLIESQNSNDLGVIVFPLRGEDLKEPSIPKVTTKEEWRVGETVNISMEYPNSYPLPETIYYVVYDTITWDVYLYTPPSGSNYRVDADGEDDDVISMKTSLSMEVVSSGTLHWSLTYYKDGGDLQSYGVSGNYSVAEKYISRDSRLALSLQGIFTRSTTIAHYLFLSDPTDRSSDLINSSTSGILDIGVMNHTFINVNFWFVPDIDTIFTRSLTRMSGLNTYEHKLTLENPAWGTKFTVYKPIEWDFATITPDSDTAIVSNNLEISNTVPTTQEIYFTQTMDKQYLAISSEKEYDYEGSHEDIEVNGREYSSSGLNSTIVYSGAFSKRLKGDGSVTQLYFNNRDFFEEQLPFYMGLAVYIESGSGSANDIRIYYYDYEQDTFLQKNFGDLTQNRWHYLFYYFKTLKWDSTYGAIGIESNYNPSVFFIDSIEFLYPNHQVETLGYRQLKVSGQLRSWDGYDNPVVDSETVNLELRDRTADSSITSTTKTTDSNGNFDWTIDTSSHSELQDQREIEVRSWSYNSWFGIHSYEEYDAVTDFTISSATSSSESIDTSNYQTGDSSYKAEVEDTDSSNSITLDHETLDLSNIDYFVFDIKGNKTLTSTYLSFFTDGSNYYNLRPAYAYSTSWVTYKLDLDDLHSTVGNPNWTSIAYLYWVITVSNYSIWIDSIRFLQTQKSYFTPMKATDWDRHISIEWFGKDGIDFSEKTIEGLLEGGGASGSASAIDGFLNYTITGTTESYKNIYFRNPSDSSQDINYDTTVYTYFIIRIKASESAYFVFSDSTGSNYLFSLQTVTTSYQIFDIEADPYYWSGTEERFYLKFFDSSGNFEGDEQFYIDFIRIVHRDTPSLSVANSYAYLSSSNNSLDYRLEIDDALQGYYHDITEIKLNRTIGVHTINATPYRDRDRSTTFFLPATSLTDTFTIAYYVTISTPILVDGRVSIAVVTSEGNAEVHINDDSKDGTEVDWETEGVFSWYSNIVGENNITIQVRKDLNNDGDYLDEGEIWTDSISYHLYDEDLSIISYSFQSYTDEGASFTFMSNYRGAGKTEYRCRITDDLGWSGWLSEDDYNGTYDFTFSVHDLDVTYNFSVEIRAYITDENPSYQYKYLRFEFTPYSADVTTQNPQGINPPEEEEEVIPAKAPLSIQLVLVFIIGIVISAVIVSAVTALTVYYLMERKEGESPLDFATRKTEETTTAVTEKAQKSFFDLGGD